MLKASFLKCRGELTLRCDCSPVEVKKHSYNVASNYTFGEGTAVVLKTGSSSQEIPVSCGGIDYLVKVTDGEVVVT